MDQALSAQCRCGAVTVKAARPPILQLVCHCHQCRQVAQSAFTNFAFFWVADVVVEGERSTHPFVAASGCKTTRETCVACGQMMVDRTEGFPKIVGIVADRIQPPFKFQPRCDVWVEDAVVTPAVTPGVERFQQGMT